MPAEIQMAGLKYGKLTVIRKTRTENKVIYYLCKCDCGNEMETRGRTLRRGESKSCGCDKGPRISKSRLSNLVGRKFGLLTAIERVENHKGTNKPVWLCICECGNSKKITSHALINNLTTSCGCKQFRTGSDHPSWKGGRQITKEGYVLVYAPDNPMSNMKGYVAEHRLNMAKKIGRNLFKNETPHHKNGIRHDNSDENLELWVKPHVPGQRIKDLVEFARKVLSDYGHLKL